MVHTETSLGTKARCMVTGFEGIITGRCEYLNGCTQFLVSPPVDEDAKMRKGEWIDNQQLEVVDIGLADKIPGPVAENNGPGGPQRDAPPT